MGVHTEIHFARQIHVPSCYCQGINLLALCLKTTMTTHTIHIIPGDVVDNTPIPH
jgi:hypothetical protein